MSEQTEPSFDVFAFGRGAKFERQRLLGEALAGPAPDADTRGGNARAQLEQLLDPDALARLDAVILQLVTGEAEREPQSFFDVVGAAQAARQGSLRDTRLGATN